MKNGSSSILQASCFGPTDDILCLMVTPLQSQPAGSAEMCPTSVSKRPWKQLVLPGWLYQWFHRWQPLGFSTALSDQAFLTLAFLGGLALPLVLGLAFVFPCISIKHLLISCVTLSDHCLLDLQFMLESRIWVIFFPLCILCDNGNRPIVWKTLSVLADNAAVVCVPYLLNLLGLSGLHGGPGCL